MLACLLRCNHLHFLHFFLPLCVTHCAQAGLGSHYLAIAKTGLEAVVFLRHLGKVLQLSLVSVRPFPMRTEGLNTEREGSRCCGPLNLKLQM